MVTVRRERFWRSWASSRAAPWAADWPASDMAACSGSPGVELRDGQLPQVLVQMTGSELSLGHKRDYRVIQDLTVDDG